MHARFKLWKLNIHTTNCTPNQNTTSMSLNPRPVCTNSLMHRILKFRDMLLAEWFSICICFFPALAIIMVLFLKHPSRLFFAASIALLAKYLLKISRFSPLANIIHDAWLQANHGGTTLLHIPFGNWMPISILAHNILISDCANCQNVMNTNMYIYM